MGETLLVGLSLDLRPLHMLQCNIRKEIYEIVYTTFSNGSLGSRIDEERSEMR
jgi:hypothetical protein